MLEGPEPIETGDVLGLCWRGELLPPLLAAPGTCEESDRFFRQAIVVDVDPLQSVTVALLEDGRAAAPQRAHEAASAAGGPSPASTN